MPAFALLVGCGRERAPDYADLEAQLLRHAFEAMAEGDTERTVRVFQRLTDVVPEETFYQTALAREQDRRFIEALNERLRAGDVDGVTRVLEDGRTRAFKAASSVRDLDEALAALQDYVSAHPFTDSGAASAALERLLARTDVLSRSEVFRAYVAAERQALAAMRAEEHAQALRAALRILDVAIVSEAPEVRERLAAVRKLAPEHPVIRSIGVLENGGDVRDVLPLVAAEDGPAAVEMAVCFLWDSRNRIERWRVNEALAQRPPASGSGAVLRARLALHSGRPGAALDAVAFLFGVMCPGPSVVAEFLTVGVMPQPQYSARCWLSPCPSVTDYLSRIQQIRSQP